MKNGRMQAKDVPDLPVLQFIHEVRTNGVIFHAREPGGYGDGERWRHVTWFAYGVDDDFIPANSVRNAMPVGTPGKVVLAKMKRLIDRGLVDGCPCGCRGDYELTDAGRAAIGVVEQTAPSLSSIANEMFDAPSIQHFVTGSFTAWATEILALSYPQFVSRMFPEPRPEPIATIGTTPVFSDDIMQALADAGITVEDLPDRTILHFPATGAIDGRVLREALYPGAARLTADDLFFPKPAPPPPPGPSYLQHDPTKSFRRRRRGR